METGLEKKIARLTEAQKLRVAGYVDFLLDEEGKKELLNEPETVYRASGKKGKHSGVTRNATKDVVAGTEKPIGVKKLKREFGSLKGFITYIADDFDAPLDDFKDYM
jgi:hypothetical protein